MQWTDRFSFVTGVVRYPDLAALAMVSDERAAKRQDHTYFLTWDGGAWGGEDEPKPWGVVSMVVCTHPIEQTVALGAGGQVYCVGSGDIHDELIDTRDGGDVPRTMRGLACVDGKAIAVGMGRYVYRRDGRDVWTPLDDGARQERGDPNVVGFEAVDGFSSSEMYAAGWNGEIWSWDGESWTPVQSPVNLTLSTVCCADDGEVYVAGRRGLLLRGRGRRWSVIQHDDHAEDIWDLAWFRGDLYVSTSVGLYRLVDDHLRHVDMGEDWPRSYFHLSAIDEVLWSIGAKDVLAYDGSRWTRIE
jgi:hypothetical protein